MKNIDYSCGAFSATTFVKGSSLPDLPAMATPFVVASGKGAMVGVAANDEVPLFFGVKGRVIGAAKISLKDGIDEVFSNKLHATITQYNLDPAEIEVYIGPCLTFSHTHVERKLIEEMMDLGYGACCKRTDGVDFLDLPLMVLMQCRRQGIPMINIRIGDYDTFENPDLLHSALYGDSEKNISVATLK